MRIFEKNEVVVVTGSSSGIGKATALLAADEGAGAILVHGTNEARARAVVDAIRAKNVEAEMFVGDISEPDVPGRIIAAAEKYFGRLDVLINNAGKSDRAAVDEMSYDFTEWLFRLNCFSVMFASQAAIDVFKRHNINGSILNNSSMNAICGQGNLVPYSATKAAIENFTSTVGHDLAMRRRSALEGGPAFPHVRMNSVLTGWIASEGETVYKRQETPDAPDDWMDTPPLGGVPTGVMTKPLDVAKQFLFLASEHCWNVNGQSFAMEQFNLAGPPAREIIATE